MRQLSSFDFEGNSLSVFVDDLGRDWFRGTEVCRILKIANPAVVIKREADEYWTELQIGAGRPALYVSEPGLYALIFASKTPDAKRFQRWVFEDVLPKLRSRGGYIMENATAEQLTALQSEIKTLQRQNKFWQEQCQSWMDENESTLEAWYNYIGLRQQQKKPAKNRSVDVKLIAEGKQSLTLGDLQNKRRELMESLQNNEHR